jgi:GDP-L-fucose synthase
MITLVTGADGLVGRAIRSIAPENFIFTTRADVDLRLDAETLSLFKQINPDRVIHLAAHVGGIGGNIMHSADFFKDNILINMNVLEAARKSGVKKLISFMSTCVFPNEGPYPLEPANLHLGAPHPSNFGYAYAKRMLEVQTRAYRAQWGMNYQIAIPSNIYGPYDNFSLEEGHVVPALIHKAMLARKSNEPLKIWGSGNPQREFVYSKDVAKLVLWMLENYESAEPLILSSGVETTIRELAETISRSFDHRAGVELDISKPEGQIRKPSNVEPLLTLLPNFKFTPLDDGIQETVAWFMKNYPEIRK